LKDISFLKRKANQFRVDVLRKTYETKKGHIGGTFSCIDILVYLYYNLLHIPSPTDSNRDRVVIGKGHICYALYCIFADLGWIDNELLDEWGKNGSFLGGQLHIDTPGVEYSSGSLGHAVGVGAGMAWVAKHDGRRFKVYALIGDGECAEGSIWEAISFAVAAKLDNLIVIVDSNKLSATDVSDDPLLPKKFESFGCTVYRVDGHDFQALDNCFSNISALGPSVVIADTIKGKGISFAEHVARWHNGIPSEQEYFSALTELSALGV
jgi:transketolase